MDQIITPERAKLGPDNNVTVYIYIYIHTHLWVKLGALIFCNPRSIRGPQSSAESFGFRRKKQIGPKRGSVRGPKLRSTRGPHFARLCCTKCGPLVDQFCGPLIDHDICSPFNLPAFPKLPNPYFFSVKPPNCFLTC